MLLEIMTEAVVGRGEYTLSWCHQVAAQDVTQILGVHIGQTTCAVRTEQDVPHAELTVDADLWALAPDGTKVLHTRCRTVREVPVTLRGTLLGEPAYELRLAGGPRTTAIRTEPDAIYVDFEATVEIEARALTRYWVRAEDSVNAH